MLRLRRNEGAGGDGGGGNDPAGSNGGGNNGGGGGNGPEPIQMTPAQLEERLSRAANAERTRLLSDLGVSSVEDARAAVQAAAEARSATQSEIERANEARLAAETRAQQAEQRAREAAVAQALMAEAGRQGIPFDRIGAAVRLVDASAVQYGDDGTVTGAEDAVKQMLDANPFIKGQTQQRAPGAADGGSRGGANASGLSAQELEAAAITGVSPERYAAAKGASADLPAYHQSLQKKD